SVFGGATRLRPVHAQAGLFHSLDQAFRTHVGPVFVDIVEAGSAGIRGVHNGPAFRYIEKSGPKRVLALLVDQNMKGPCLCFERVRHFVLHGWVDCGAAVCFTNSLASTVPISAAGSRSIMASCAQSISCTLMR